MNNLNPKQPIGLTLVEVMIGMTILGIVIGSSLLAVVQVRELNYRSDATRGAYTALNGELENLRTQTFAQLSASVTSADANATSSTSTSTSSINGVSYNVSRTLQFEDSAKEIVLANVMITWTFGDRESSITGRSLFTINGLSDKKFSTAN
ncbi:MAG: prepilin-type N-terminal cleavage/methylation domain-containing protein [Verrucomicrobiota bacterium]